MHRLFLADLAFTVQPAEEWEYSERIRAAFQDDPAVIEELVKRALSDIAVCGDDDLAEMSLFTFGLFEDVYRIIVLVSVILIKKDTARSLAVFRAGIARVVSQKAFCLVVFDDFLGDPEFSLEFRIP